MRQASPWAPERNSTGVSIVARPHSPHAISSPMTAASSVTRVISAGSGLSSTRPNLAEWWAPDASVQVRRARAAPSALQEHTWIVWEITLVCGEMAATRRTLEMLADLTSFQRSGDFAFHS